MLHYQLFWKKCITTINMPKQTGFIFTTNNDDIENLWLHGPASTIFSTQCGKLNFWSTHPETDVPHMFYTKFHLPRKISTRPAQNALALASGRAFVSLTVISTIISWWVKLGICIAQILIITHVQCKCNQPQLGQSIFWANYIMIVKTTSSRNVCCMWKKNHHVPKQLINDGCQLFINGISVGVKYEGDKPIPVMITLNPIPQAITKVVSCGFKTNCCNGGVNAIKYNCIAHSPANRESNTIRNTADVSEFWKWLNH